MIIFFYLKWLGARWTLQDMPNLQRKLTKYILTNKTKKIYNSSDLIYVFINRYYYNM